jgi:hypothetical protein
MNESESNVMLGFYIKNCWTDLIIRIQLLEKIISFNRFSSSERLSRNIPVAENEDLVY